MSMMSDDGPDNPLADRIQNAISSISESKSKGKFMGIGGLELLAILVLVIGIVIDILLERRRT